MPTVTTANCEYKVCTFRSRGVLRSFIMKGDPYYMWYGWYEEEEEQTCWQAVVLHTGAPVEYVWKCSCV